MKITNDKVEFVFKGNSHEARAARVAMSLYLSVADDLPQPAHDYYENILSEASENEST